MVRKVSVKDSNVSYNIESKTAISVRDGVLEYYGIELGLEPAAKIFTVYRSPATIANAAAAMRGIPFTDEHLDRDEELPNQKIGMVNDSRMIDMVDESTDTRLAVENIIDIGEAFTLLLSTGKRELSLGYDADLIEHERYDFEQINIAPHHLALVQSGRCGPSCRFSDRKPPTEESPMPKKLTAAQLIAKHFCDEDGAVSLEQVVEIAMALPEAIKKVPVDKLQEIMPALLQVIEYAKNNGVEMTEETTQADPEAKAEDSDKDADKSDDDKKVEVKDSKAFADALKTATADAVKLHSEVVDKARTFVDEAYSFSGKTSAQIMRDALATEHGSTVFTDSELPVAFKLLKKTVSYQKFGDASKEGGLTARVQAHLKEED